MLKDSGLVGQRSIEYFRACSADCSLFFPWLEAGEGWRPAATTTVLMLALSDRQPAFDRRSNTLVVDSGWSFFSILRVSLKAFGSASLLRLVAFSAEVFFVPLLSSVKAGPGCNSWRGADSCSCDIASQCCQIGGSPKQSLDPSRSSFV